MHKLCYHSYSLEKINAKSLYTSNSLKEILEMKEQLSQ